MTAFDTNILIYSCDKRDPVRRQRTIDLLTATSDGVMLWQVACEFVAASRKLASSGFTARDAWSRLAEFLSLFPLMLPTPPVLNRAQELHTAHGWTTLYTEDLPGIVRLPNLAIVNPFV
jgi:predicted nucleic acid-binding protein